MLPTWSSADAQVSALREHSAEEGHLAHLTGVTLPMTLWITLQSPLVRMTAGLPDWQRPPRSWHAQGLQREPQRRLLRCLRRQPGPSASDRLLSSGRQQRRLRCSSRWVLATHVMGAGAQGKLGAAVQLAAYAVDLPARGGMPLQPKAAASDEHLEQTGAYRAAGDQQWQEAEAWLWQHFLRGVQARQRSEAAVQLSLCALRSHRVGFWHAVHWTIQQKTTSGITCCCIGLICTC